MAPPSVALNNSLESLAAFHWKLTYDGTHRYLIPLIAECMPLDVALAYRFIKFYRTVALSDNMVVNYIVNTITFAYRSTLGQNVRHIVSKYNMPNHELLYTPVSAIKHTCKEMWNVNATYYDNANMICELVEMKDCNNDAVLNKEECNVKL